MSGHRVLHDAAKAVFTIPDPGASGTLHIDRHDAIVELVSAAAGETRTLLDPRRAGLRCTIRMKTDGGGDIVMTAANGLNVAGNTQATFADVGDQLELIAVSHTTGYRWEILVNTGAVALA